jgi:hypothetical protein
VAYIKSAAIVTRIRELLEDGRGALRAITEGRFLGDLPEGLSIDAQHMRTVTGARAASSIGGATRNAGSPPIMGNLILYDVPVRVRVIRLITPLEQIDDESREALEALALSDIDIVRQALECEGNVGGTEAIVTGSGGTFPTTFAGGETLVAEITDVDGSTVTVTTTFADTDQTATQCAAAIEAACVAEGLPAGRAGVSDDGQIEIVAANTGDDASVEITGGSGAATLGLSGLSAEGDSTELASRMLRWTGSTQVVLGEVDNGAQTLETVHDFTGVAISRPATS